MKKTLVSLIKRPSFMIIFIISCLITSCKNVDEKPQSNSLSDKSRNINPLKPANVNVVVSGQINLAQGKPYTSSVAASGTYPDGGTLELTDGTVASGVYTTAPWQGRSVASYTHVIDLGVNSTVGEVACRFLQNTSAGINFPTTVTFATSINNTTYTNMTATTNTTITSTIKRYQSSPTTAVTARFIKMTVTGSGWLFEDNFEVLGTSPAKILSGTFIQPNSTNLAWGATDFATVYTYLRNLKMGHIIWQATANTKPDANNKKHTYFPITAPLTSANWIQENAGSDPIEASLAQARVYGQKVWLGLNQNSDWWNNLGNNTTWLNQEFTYSNQVAQALWNKYGTNYSDVIAGFYIWHEIYNQDFDAQAQLNMQAALRSTVDYIHTNIHKPVMIAPYFITDPNLAPFQSAADYATTWVNYAKAPTSSNIDVIAVQDGVGSGYNTTTTMLPYFSALKNAFTTNGVTSQLWADIETLTPTFGTAPSADVINKIKLLQPYVSGATSFSIIHYDDPSHPEYNQLKTYVETLDASR